MGKARWLLLGFWLYSTLFFYQKINLTTADLGRHLINGQIILTEGLKSKVLSTNYYSLTQARQPIVNHHWLYGVIVQLIFRIGNFQALSIFNLSLYSLGIALILLTSYKKTSAQSTLMAGFIALPLIVSRTEVRPEAMSFICLALLNYLLSDWLSEESSHQKKLLALVGIFLLFLVWTNLHLFFVLGWGLIGSFWLVAVWKKLIDRSISFNRSSNKRWQWLSLAGLLAVIAGIFNPNGLNGLLMPFQIFKNYQYRVVENQSVWFLLKNFPQANYWYLLVSLVLTLTFLIIYLGYTKSQKKSKKTKLMNNNFGEQLLFFLALGGINLLIIRLSPFTGLMMIPVLSLVLFNLPLKNWWERFSSRPILLMVISIIATGLLIILLATNLMIPKFASFGTGVFREQLKAIAFIKKLNGPIINNYDVGGFLIYSNFPKEKIYTDNRPEAYPAGFFPDQYIKPLEKEPVWQKLDKVHNFQSLVFYRHDLTPWAQQFMMRRVDDHDWVPVYVDHYLLILVKNSEKNQQLIKHYQLPKSIFKKS